MAKKKKQEKRKRQMTVLCCFCSTHRGEERTDVRPLCHGCSVAELRSSSSSSRACGFFSLCMAQAGASLPDQIHGEGRKRGSGPASSKRSVSCVVSSQQTHRSFMRHRVSQRLKQKQKKEKRLSELCSFKKHEYCTISKCTVHTCDCCVVHVMAYKTLTTKRQEEEFWNDFFGFSFPSIFSKGVTPWLVAWVSLQEPVIVFLFLFLFSLLWRLVAAYAGSHSLLLSWSPVLWSWRLREPRIPGRELCRWRDEIWASKSERGGKSMLRDSAGKSGTFARLMARALAAGKHVLFCFHFSVLFFTLNRIHLYFVYNSLWCLELLFIPLLKMYKLLWDFEPFE